MRAILLGTALLTLVSAGSSFAQDSTPNVSRPAQSQLESNTSKTDSPIGNGQKNQTLERMGPGIDWDHRKPGRDWKVMRGRARGQADTD